MSNLKDQLIKLGSENPSLQKHLRPVLDSIKTANDFNPNEPPPEGAGRDYAAELGRFFEDFVRETWSRSRRKQFREKSIVGYSVKFYANKKKVGGGKGEQVLSLKPVDGKIELKMHKGRSRPEEYTFDTPKDAMRAIKNAQINI